MKHFLDFSGMSSVHSSARIPSNLESLYNIVFYHQVICLCILGQINSQFFIQVPSLSDLNSEQYQTYFKLPSKVSFASISPDVDTSEEIS